MNTENITLFSADGTTQTNPEMDPEIEKMLREIYQIVKEAPGYPLAFCPEAGIAFSNYGLMPETGWFLVDRIPKENSRSERFRTHVWTPSSDKKSIYDLTLSQFNAYLYQSVPEGILVIEQRCELARRYFDQTNPVTAQLGLI